MILHHLTELRGLNYLPACNIREKSHPWIIGTCILWAFWSKLWKHVVSLLSPCVAPSSPASVVLTAAVRAFQMFLFDGFFMTTGMPSPQQHLVSHCRPFGEATLIKPVLDSSQRSPVLWTVNYNICFFNLGMLIKDITVCINLLCFHIQPNTSTIVSYWPFPQIEMYLSGQTSVCRGV